MGQCRRSSGDDDRTDSTYIEPVAVVLSIVARAWNAVRDMPLEEAVNPVVRRKSVAILAGASHRSWRCGTIQDLTAELVDMILTSAACGKLAMTSTMVTIMPV